MYNPRKIITLSEMKLISERTKVPADLIEILPAMNIDLEFVEHITRIWRKEFDRNKDDELLGDLISKSDPIVKEFLDKYQN